MPRATRFCRGTVVVPRLQDNRLTRTLPPPRRRKGCTTTAWHVQDAVYLNARGVSFAVLTSGPWDEVAPYVEFMGYTQPWYSARGVGALVGGDMGHIACFPRHGDRVFLSYSTTGRGNESANGSLGLTR